jgi:hypothetical protein
MALLRVSRLSAQPAVCPVPIAVTCTSDNVARVSALFSTVESHSRVTSSGYRGMDNVILAPFALLDRPHNCKP